MNDLKPFEKLKVYEEDLQLAKSKNDAAEILFCLHKLGTLCYEIEANELGIKYIEEALTLGAKQPHFTDRYIFYLMLGDLNLGDGKIKEAYNLYEKSNNEIPKNQEGFKVENYYKLAKVSRLLGKSIGLIAGFYLRAAKISAKLNNFSAVAKCYERIGVLYLDKAEAKPDKKYMYTRVYDPYGKHSGRTAVKYWKKGLKVLEKYNLQDNETELYSDLLSHLKFASDLSKRFK